MSTSSEPQPAVASDFRARYSANRLLAGIAEDKLALFLREIKEEVYEPGVVVFEENDLGEAMFLIGSGSVKISKKGRGGRQETLARLESGDFFGEMALIDAKQRSAQACADQHTYLGRIDEKAWSKLLQIAPEVLLSNFTRSMTQRLRANNQHFIEEMLRTERLSMLGGTVGAIAHDMNNPISCILGACQLLQMKAKGEIVTEMTDIILKSVDRMSSMTRELLEFARGITNLSIMSVPVSELMQDLDEEMRYQDDHTDEPATFDVRYTGFIEVDPMRILRLLVNLVRNGKDAMAKGGSVHVEVYDDGKDIVFEVKDTGRGIPPEFQARIFEPFVTIGKHKGTGLGLAIAKSVVEAHKGSISVKSEVGVGSTFTVRLPKVRAKNEG